MPAQPAAAAASGTPRAHAPARLAGFVRTLQRAWQASGATRDATAPLLSASDWREIASLAASARAAALPARQAMRRNPGEGASPFKGRGLDYAESRVYQPGDELRAMHWALLARTGVAYVKLHHEEHAGGWHGLLDLQATMMFGTRVRTKAQQAARAVVLGAARAADASPQSAIACTLWRADGMHGQTFGRGLAAVRRLAGWLMQQEVAPQRPRAPDPTAIDAWVQALRRGRDQPTQVLMASDFAWLNTHTQTALRRLAASAELLAVNVRDVAESALPELGRVWFADIAHGTQGWLDVTAGLRQRFEQLAQSSTDSRTRHLRAAGAGFARLAVSADIAQIDACLREAVRGGSPARAARSMPPALRT